MLVSRVQMGAMGDSPHKGGLRGTLSRTFHGSTHNTQILEFQSFHHFSNTLTTDYKAKNCISSISKQPVTLPTLQSPLLYTLFLIETEIVYFYKKQKYHSTYMYHVLQVRCTISVHVSDDL